ncbi:MAG: hypothetical protein HY607_00070 [Planctomycetes bacterium]|uniref:hypothetical protein n=1 Tax=Candidatus Wunengus californicus TaxID=3367619 RepID=UPI00402889CA|nr:hypothetical protein [Planctomycetota bacterium]MBI4221065.1 hypothetical protein [Planctomycetota bacterium]
MEDIKTEKTKKINSKTLIVAMDVAQEKHMVYFRCPDGREEKPFVVFNKREEYDQMWERISQTKDAYRLEEVVVGFESAVPYAAPLVHYLMKKEVKTKTAQYLLKQYPRPQDIVGLGCDGGWKRH